MADWGKKKKKVVRFRFSYFPVFADVVRWSQKWFCCHKEERQH